MQIVAKKRISFLGLWIFLFFLLISAVPVVTLGSLFFNKETHEDVTENTTAKEAGIVFNNIFNSSMSNVKNSGEMKFEITQDDINSILQTGVQYTLDSITDEQIKSEVENIVKNVYFEINQDNYTLGLDANLYGFKTNIEFVSRLAWDYDDKDILDRSIYFQILDLRLGNVSVLKSLVGEIPEELISQAQVDDYVSQLGLSLQVSLKELKITYKISDAILDLTNMMSSDSQDYSIFVDAIKDFAKKDIFDISFNKDKKISAKVDLSPFADNERLCTHDKDKSELTNNIEIYRDYVELLRNLPEPIASSQSSIVFRFLARGYKGLVEEDKNTILSLKEIIQNNTIDGLDPITDVTTYEPTYGAIETVENLDLIDALFDGINQDDLLAGKIAELDENKVNQLVDSTYILGYSLFIENTIEDENGNSHKELHYIIIDNFYCNIVDGHIYFTLGINVNGYEIVATILFHVNHDEAAPYSLTLYAETIYIGEIKFSNDLKETIYPIIANAFNGMDMLSFNKENGHLTISFEQYMSSITTQLEDIGLPGKFDDYAVIDVELYGMLNDNGYMSVTWKLK